MASGAEVLGKGGRCPALSSFNASAPLPPVSTNGRCEVDMAAASDG